MVIAYLRVSTEKQFLENQKDEILRFASKYNLVIDKWCKETVSGSISAKERKLAKLIRGMKPGDALIITEISRLSRTLLEIMNILNHCIRKNIILYSTKEGYVFQDDINSKVLGFAFGLVAEIERNLISIRTKEALARRKDEGKKLGRKKGSSTKMKLLHKNRRMITEYLEEGLSYEVISKRLRVSRSTLSRYIKAEMSK
jgi:DNA invertase Pin-like site-specific DNA recombinase